MSEYDERTPGLMKIEYVARELTCICAKSYYADAATEQHEANVFAAKKNEAPIPEYKDSAKKGMKGIQKSNPVNMELFKKAQAGDKTHTVINRGFRKTTGVTKTMMGLQLYSQEKKGICAGDTKRIILSNGINRAPLEWPGYYTKNE